MQNLELSQASGYRHSEEVSLLNLGTTCELLGKLDKAIEWHTLVSWIEIHTKAADMYICMFTICIYILIVPEFSDGERRPVRAGWGSQNTGRNL